MYRTEVVGFVHRMPSSKTINVHCGAYFYHPLVGSGVTSTCSQLRFHPVYCLKKAIGRYIFAPTAPNAIQQPQLMLFIISYSCIHGSQFTVVWILQPLIFVFYPVTVCGSNVVHVWVHLPVHTLSSILHDQTGKLWDH